MKYRFEKKNIVILVLFVFIIFLLFKVVSLRAIYRVNIVNKVIVQNVGGIKYKTIQSDKSPYRVIIGDILGIDKKAYQLVDNLIISEDNPILAISGVNKEYSEITKNNFSRLIANKNNVFIPDNFCIKDWPSELNEDMYNNSQLSRGSFCGSEDETIIIDRLIKQYKVQKIEIYYSSETYRELLGGFLLYLDDLNIDYEFKKLE